MPNNFPVQSELGLKTWRQSPTVPPKGTSFHFENSFTYEIGAFCSQKNKKSKVEVVIESPRYSIQRIKLLYAYCPSCREANRKYKSDIENQRRTSVKNSKKKQAKEK